LIIVILNLKAKIQKQGSRIDQNQSKNFKKYENIARGYDILGNIAIIKYINKSEKSKKLIGKAEQIAKWIINSNPSIKTVVAQTSPISGKFRLRKFKYISGIKTFIATYKENNCIFKFDIRKTFFQTDYLMNDQE
jgi:Predicted methyltransferase